MKSNSSGLRTTAGIIALLLAAILIAGIFGVPFRATRPPSSKDQPRAHLNTKNSTRFEAATPTELASLVSRAVYPAVDETNRPGAVLLYDPNNWQAGLAATSLLRPMQAVLLPAGEGVAEQIQGLQPSGGSGLEANVFLLDGLEAPDGVSGNDLALADIPAMLTQLEAEPRNVILVDRDNPQTALLAAPWAAYSGDLIVFDPQAAPPGIPGYSLGVDAEGFTRIPGSTPEELAVNFAKYEDSQNPFFGWGMDADTLTGYRAYILANPDQPAIALVGANLATHGKPGPLIWTGAERLPTLVNDYFWSQRAAFWVTPAEGPFHHFWVLGDESLISFAAQSQADYAVEIGPYLGKGIGMSGIDMLAAAWVLFGMASAGWILFHQEKFLAHQNWVMKLAWPLLALMIGPFGILLYYLAYDRPVIHLPNGMLAWDRPLWLQGLVATVSAVGFGASIMIVTGFITTSLGMPLLPNSGAGVFLLGTPMIQVMIINYVVAVIVSWLVFQTPMMAMFYGLAYREALGKALPMVLLSMLAAAVGMNPSMWWFMMSKIPMMPTEELILWFGVMFFTAFVALLVAWPLNYLLVRQHRKSGLM